MARNMGVKQLGNTLKPLAGSRVQISLPAHITWFADLDIRSFRGIGNPMVKKGETKRLNKIVFNINFICVFYV